MKPVHPRIRVRFIIMVDTLKSPIDVCSGAVNYTMKNITNNLKIYVVLQGGVNSTSYCAEWKL